MKTCGAQEAFEMRGVFWLPEAREQHLSGTLHFSPSDGVELRLIGRFGEPQNCFPVVHGVVEDANCTLFACTAGRLKSSALTLTEFQVELAIIGASVRSVEEATFSKARVRFDCLDEWVDFTAFSAPDADRRRRQGPSRFEICDQPTMLANVGALGCTISLAGAQQGTFSKRRIDWEYHSFLEIACSKPWSVQDLCRTVIQLKHLLSLLTWQRVRLADLSFGDWSSLSATGGNALCGVFGAGEAQSKPFHASNWLLTHFNDLAPYFPRIMGTWFAGDKRLRNARALLTGLINSEGQFLEFEFLALVQIAEALHRIKNAGGYMSEGDYAVVRSAMESAIPSTVERDHRQSLKSRIKYGNELSLRTKLKQLCMGLPDGLRNVLAKDLSSFISMVVDGRNYLTHRDEELASRELKSEELKQTSQKLKLLLSIHFFQSLGIPFEAIERICHDRDWYTRQIAW